MSVLVACTMGDPAGIGPEVTVRACTDLSAEPPILPPHDPVVGSPPGELGVLLVGSARVFRRAAAALPDPGPERSAAPLDPDDLAVVEDVAAARRRFEEGDRGPWILEPPADDDDPRSATSGGATGEATPIPTPGRPDRSGARAALEAIRVAADLASEGLVDALCTAPVHKEGIAAVEPRFRGHTEYLAARAGTREPPVMLFAGIRPHVALHTTHLPLRTALALITRWSVTRSLVRLDRGWRRHFGSRPRIGVAALNPHAGEGGLLGREEATELLPAIDAARKEGLEVSGPYPADTIFRRELDAILALYHDQGTILAKRAPEIAVNVTLGLPYPRTSPDHGTAYDIAGRGIADAAPMAAALALAASLGATPTPGG